MKNLPRLFCVLVAIALPWPTTALAQSRPVQPYVWHNVVMGGGGFVDGIVFHPAAKDLMYARTDVGGAYRWDDAGQQWIPLLDWLSPAQNNYTGIESIGLDPSDPNRLYLAAGTYMNNQAAILCSDDQGRTFKISEVPFRMGGNADGRSNGERLAVDPNDGAILFFGSRAAGLWKSTDYGATWNVVASFPNPYAAPTRPVVNTDSTHSTPANTFARGRRGGFGFGGNTAYGIVSVVFDATSGHSGAPTPVIYAAVSSVGTNLFRSADVGVTWHPVANQPVGLRPSHLIQSPDELFYLTYGNVPGPNNVTDGAVWKYNAKDGSWTNISPEKPQAGRRLGWGYGAIAVDAQHPSTIMVTSIDRWEPHDEVFRSTDGGATWRGILLNGRMDYSMAPYTSRMTPHWTGTLAINPTNPDRVLFGTGYGIWCCTNAAKTDSGGQADWIFLDKGLEETVPFALISPPSGAHLISGVGDIDGFRHDDVDVSPPEGTFTGPQFSSTRDLAYAAGKPELMVRIGNGGRGVATHAAISYDGGKIWNALHRDAPGGYGGQGKLAMSVDGSAIVWAVRRDSAFVTSDRGATWTNCQGFSGVSVVADPVNPLRFYAFDAQNGRLLVSTNQAASFEATAALLPTAPENVGRGGGGSGVLAVTTGMEGDIWVGSRNGGLFHSADGGASFAKLDNVAGVEALGFGKAAPGKNFPAIFLLGAINQLHARFRSDDAGQTWVRIDDDQHQYASADVPLIIGDPRIYGRVYFTTGGRGVIYGNINNGSAGGKNNL